MTKFWRILTTKRSTLLLWAAAAVLAVGGGTTAVAATGSDPDVLTQQDVNDRLAADNAATPKPSSSGPRSSAPHTGSPVRKDTTGGWVAVSCANGLAYLHSWSPKPGYRSDDVVRGPARTVMVEFETDTDHDVTVKASCSAPDKPLFQTKVDVDDHGGDRGDHDRDDDRGRNKGRDHPEDD